MAYTQAQFMRDLAAYTAGAVIGAKRTTNMVKFAAKKGIQLGGIVAGRAAVPAAALAGRTVAGTIAGATAPILSSPAFAPAAGIGLGAAILDTPQGQALLQAAEERGRADRVAFEQLKTDIQMAAIGPPAVARRKKVMSKFNKSVKQGMDIVKKSTSYGKKGIISSPRKAFSAITKTISKVKKGKAAPKKGILGKVAAQARKNFLRQSRGGR